MVGSLCVDTIATGLRWPWAVEVMPGGDLIITEREGRIRLISRSGNQVAVWEVPNVDDRGTGGLMDIALDPRFAQNRLIYFTYSERKVGGPRLTIARARLDDDGLGDLKPLYSTPSELRTVLYGSRIVWQDDDVMFVSVGDRNEPEEAQAQDSPLGKMLRINSDGSIPLRNPFLKAVGSLPEIWSLGHRNVIAATINPVTGHLWIADQGPAGGDELNRIEEGKNYGWPIISYGKSYIGDKIGLGVSKEGLEQPVYYWDPVIAPAGMIFYRGSAFPGWHDSILIVGLRAHALVRVTMTDGRVAHEERYLTEIGERLRDIAVDAVGRLIILTDGPVAMLLAVTPRLTGQDGQSAVSLPNVDTCP